MPSPDRHATLASRNAHKARELERLLPGWAIEPLVADDWPAETGDTYEANARIKAVFGREVLGPDATVIGEDSGLEVDALGGRPGIHSARYAPEGAPAIAKLLGELDGVDARDARYVSELVCLTPEGELRGSGTLTGRIAREARGHEGFGYDPVFVPDGERETVAELGDAWKERNSHRARAARALLAALAMTLLVAGCGGTDKTGIRVLRRFFAAGPVARKLGTRFPHKPGTLPCTVDDSGTTVQATCATDISLVKPDKAVVTLTEAWNHGAKAHTWFFFIRRDGSVQSVVQEGSPSPVTTTTSH
ncbi:MAG: non-canonical purine NTP pyrophosphatase [Actinobacteria bacterium]|nr:non-canonical purine NTP pyrophosphatase [Actinomycetota bacterium]